MALGLASLHNSKKTEELEVSKGTGNPRWLKKTPSLHLEAALGPPGKTGSV